MWFQDLLTACEAVYAWLGKDANMVCIEKITPSADGGIVFLLSNRSRIKWFQSGDIVSKEGGEWRTIPADDGLTYVSGQMVRSMITQYEKEMEK